MHIPSIYKLSSIIFGDNMANTFSTTHKKENRNEREILKASFRMLNAINTNIVFITITIEVAIILNFS